MSGFKITTKDDQEINFKFYLEAAPITCAAFVQILPFKRTFYHAKISGQEIWINDIQPLDIIQENASVFTMTGEVVLGPSKPQRTKTANCFGIYYGEGKGIDAANIFAKVEEEDLQKLMDLGNNIWKNGAREITVTPIG